MNLRSLSLASQVKTHYKQSWFDQLPQPRKNHRQYNLAVAITCHLRNPALATFLFAPKLAIFIPCNAHVGDSKGTFCQSRLPLSQSHGKNCWSPRKGQFPVIKYSAPETQFAYSGPLCIHMAPLPITFNSQPTEAGLGPYPHCSLHSKKGPWICIT